MIFMISPGMFSAQHTHPRQKLWQEMFTSPALTTYSFLSNWAEVTRKGWRRFRALASGMLQRFALRSYWAERVDSRQCHFLFMFSVLNSFGPAYNNTYRFVHVGDKGITCKLLLRVKSPHCEQVGFPKQAKKHREESNPKQDIKRLSVGKLNLNSK